MRSLQVVNYVTSGRPHDECSGPLKTKDTLIRVNYEYLAQLVSKMVLLPLVGYLRFEAVLMRCSCFISPTQ